MITHPNNAKHEPGAAFLTERFIPCPLPSMDVPFPESSKNPLTNKRYPRTMHTTPAPMIEIRYTIEYKISAVVGSVYTISAVAACIKSMIPIISRHYELQSMPPTI